MPDNIVRTPKYRLTINGREPARPEMIRIQRGMDQEHSTAQITMIKRLPDFVTQFAPVMVERSLNGGPFKVRFVGFVLNISINLWPNGVTLVCGDRLGLLKHLHPNDDLAYPNMTDEAIIAAVLDYAGMPYGEILGTGKIVGAEADAADLVAWGHNQSALSFIKEIDKISVDYENHVAYRTLVDNGGIIRRVKVTDVAGVTAKGSFYQGVDVLDGSVTFELEDIKTAVEVAGAKDTEYIAALLEGDEEAWRLNPYFERYGMLQKEAAEMGFHSLEEQALWLLKQLSRSIVRVQFSTYKGINVEPMDTLYFESDRLKIGGNFWVQSETEEIGTDSGYTQQFQLVSDLGLIFYPPIPVPAPDDGAGEQGPIKTTPDKTTGGPDYPAGGGGGGPPPPPPTGNANVTAAYQVLALDKEILADGSVLYTVACRDTSTSTQGEITGWAWTAAGTGVLIASGSQEYFNTAFTDLAGATITLTVTDANGSTGTITHILTTLGLTAKSRRLYAAAGDQFLAFDGTTWRQDAASNAHTVDALAPGPQAAAGSIELRTADDLVTAAAESEPFGPGVEVTSVWVEPDLSIGAIAVGSADGRIGLSSDGGATWTIKNGPNDGVVRKIIVSRWTPGQIHVLVSPPTVGTTIEGYYVSDNYGDGWRLIRTGDFIGLDLSPFRNVIITQLGGMEQADTGTPFTFTGSPNITSAQPHIKTDEWFAMASDGTTYRTSAEGSFVMVAKQPIPLGTGQVNGMHRDGDMPMLIYYAAGAGGLWKSIDGFETTDGFLKLREGTL